MLASVGGGHGTGEKSPYPKGYHQKGFGQEPSIPTLKGGVNTDGKVNTPQPVLRGACDRDR